jgi:NAD(P)-dependent dehydrogenase (short-subunit alcohol dehydrogenase family)
MYRKILITGATDGIGLQTSKYLFMQGHHVLLHGRSHEKLDYLKKKVFKSKDIETYTADLSSIDAVSDLAMQVLNKHTNLDVLINNAGVLKDSNTVTADGLDVRFAVNTIAPFLLTKKLLPILKNSGRVINVASAAQTNINLDAIVGNITNLDDMVAYSQSKLALIMWSKTMSHLVKEDHTVFVSVNPGSLLNTKMVTEAFGIKGKDRKIGAEILVRLAVKEPSSKISGKYFDNDNKTFSQHHKDALDKEKCDELIKVLGKLVLKKYN